MDDPKLEGAHTNFVLPRSAFKEYTLAPRGRQTHYPRVRPRHSPRERAESIPREARTPKYRPGDWNVPSPAKTLADAWMGLELYGAVRVPLEQSNEERRGTDPIDRSSGDGEPIEFPIDPAVVMDAIDRAHGEGFYGFYR